ncbi:hypothetical protein K435DRAFT_970544 [Dendrothele bispora CBS 962.96]|uniref:DUF6534 domain-containing protein n=1 Tax=Dendrothele bispora (strain CBS 962.96) TaxID=1314807 RepID=A0A4S8LAJ4_DENBC|nr:hypothetical protein K435DRAFT_970544 [Dendrothele bispora CBS 962.96]
MGNQDETLGSILIGSWVSMIISTHVAHEAVYYFRNYRGDKMALKLLVSVALFMGLILQIAACADVYMYTISNWGNEEYLLRQYWPVQLYLITTALLTLLVQSYLVHRHWILTKRSWLCILLALLAVTTFAGNIAVAWVLAIHDTYEERFSVQIPAIVWLLTQTVTDITITAALVFRLYTMQAVSKEAESIIRRIVRQAVQTGATTAIVATTALTIYLLFNMSNIETALTFVIGPLYLVTLLYNVNSRQITSNKKEDLESKPVHKRISSLSFQHGFNTAHINVKRKMSHREATQAALEGIRVHRTSVVFRSDPDSDIGSSQLEKDGTITEGDESRIEDDDRGPLPSTPSSCDTVFTSEKLQKGEGEPLSTDSIN